MSSRRVCVPRAPRRLAGSASLLARGDDALPARRARRPAIEIPAPSPGVVLRPCLKRSSSASADRAPLLPDELTQAEIGQRLATPRCISHACFARRPSSYCSPPRRTPTRPRSPPPDRAEEPRRVRRWHCRRRSRSRCSPASPSSPLPPRTCPSPRARRTGVESAFVAGVATFATSARRSSVHAIPPQSSAPLARLDAHTRL